MSEPAGVVITYAGSTAPEGWLLCDGSAVSRDTYATLFDIIGTAYGVGDGSTTFNVPNLSGRVVIGPSQSHALGSTGGSETITLTESELPAHAHEVPKHGHANTIAAATPKFVHSITQAVFKYTGTGTAKAGSGSDGKIYTSTSSSTATRSTNASITAHAAANCTMSGSIANKAAFTSNASGGGLAHNNMQPYLPLTFIICTGE